jgi:Fic family protein
MVFTNPSYQKTFQVSKSTAARDLKELLEHGLILKLKKGKNTQYKAI